MPLVGEVAVERQLHVAGAFEFFEDHLIHPAAGVDQASGEDRQRAAVLRSFGRRRRASWGFPGRGCRVRPTWCGRRWVRRR